MSVYYSCMAESKGGGGGGMDLMTFLVGLILIGALAQTGYTQIKKIALPAEEAPAQQTATSTESTSETADTSSIER